METKAMSIKEKWNKLRFGNAGTYTWVFAEGKMFAISEAAHDQVKQHEIKSKAFYENSIIKRKKRKVT